MTRRPSTALTGAAVCASGLLALWFLAMQTALGHRIDAAALGGFVGLQRPRVTPTAQFVASLADPRPFVLIGAALVCIAIARGRPRLALVVPLVLGLANVTTQVLKVALADPRVAAVLGDHQIDAASFPSGHATASMSLALCAVLVVGPRLRPLVAALGSAYAIAVAYAVLTLNWHYPSDVLGGYLVAGMFTSLGVAALLAAEARFPERAGRRAALRLGQAVAPSALVAVGLAGAAGAVALLRPDRALAYAEAHTSFVVIAAAIGLLGTLLAATLAVVLRRAS